MLARAEPEARHQIVHHHQPRFPREPAGEREQRPLGVRETLPALRATLSKADTSQRTPRSLVGAAPAARAQQRQGDELDRTQVELGMAVFEQRDVAAEQRRAAAIGELPQLDAVETHGAPVRPHHAGGDTHDRRLALRALRKHREQLAGV